MARIVVTGSEGYIGTYLVRKLAASEHEILGLDVKNGEDEDICRPETISRIQEFQPEVIYNLAGVSKENSTEAPKARTFEVNCWAPFRIHSAVKARFIQASSASILSLRAGLDLPYSESKLKFEKVSRGVRPRSRIVARFGTVFGENRYGGMRWDLPFNKMVKDCVDRGEITAPRQKLWRPWVHIDCLTTWLAGLVHSGTWDFPIPVCSFNMSLDVVAANIQKVLGQGSIVEHDSADLRNYRMPTLLQDHKSLSTEIWDLSAFAKEGQVIG
ncbi:MAG: hypothetical protein AMK69_11075 [Nitrospira bacterium SG8_3]|nr:MAG: hypothetical protein AMK69_11075 [Nitrospira bacterium SG8_3]